MKHLGFDIRDSLKSDGDLKFIGIDTTINPEHKNAGGVFNRSKAGRVLDSNGKAVKYAHPIIYIEAYADSVLNDRKDTSEFVELYAKSIIVHELTHFLQQTVYITHYPRNGLTLYDYFMLPDENEACTVQAYFFLKHYNQDILKSIQPSGKDPMIYRIMLFDAMKSIFISKSREFRRIF